MNDEQLNLLDDSDYGEIVDFVIVTALEEERDAVLDKLPGYQRGMPSHDDVRIYFSSSLPAIFPDGSTCTYRVIVLPLLGMGRVQATTATVDAIRRWHPRYVILVGIAGGIAARSVNLGDILVSDQIVDYELQRLTPKGPQVRWEVYRADARLVGAARNFSSDDWQKLMTTGCPGGGAPVRHIGPIASGDKVIAFGKVLAKYHDKWPMLIGVEMEAAGVAAAAFQAAESPGFFMVRGVSDLADEKKGSARVKKWRPYACDVAASYAIALLKSGPVLPSSDDERPSAGGPSSPDSELVPEGTQPVLTTSDLEELADLLRRSGRAGYSAREALCIKIRVDLGDLDFAQIAARDFALQLVYHLHQTGNVPGLLRLCDAIALILKGPYAETLVTIRAKLQAR